MLLGRFDRVDQLEQVGVATVLLGIIARGQAGGMPFARDGEEEAIGDRFLLASAGSDKRAASMRRVQDILPKRMMKRPLTLFQRRSPTSVS